MWGIFFGEFQCLPVDDSSAVSCDSGALAGESEHMSFSAILNQSPHTFKYQHILYSFHIMLKCQSNEMMTKRSSKTRK